MNAEQAVRNGCRTAAEVAEWTGTTEEAARTALDALVAAGNLVTSKHGGYLPPHTGHRLIREN